MRYYKLAINF
ncbi:hypothetical protein CGLO_00061 [Colletotrichum gloeosporioides Cg-14]|uniref:Uncharacterized protein n=1 Tax=Colletotrichum gloeosporioides (strain Cg-14) TaxID=1237896 RepID=T0L4V4_COLGC|nr:hypothetical protein CGLO_00061 [Colletotrichum gloeosporioides Cg-14]